MWAEEGEGKHNQEERRKKEAGLAVCCSLHLWRVNLPPQVRLPGHIHVTDKDEEEIFLGHHC